MRKRHIVTDTIGPLLGFAVHGAEVPDRDGAPGLLKSISITYPLLRHVFADGGYAGPTLKGALEKIGRWTMQIVKWPDTAQGVNAVPPQVGGRADLRIAWKLPPNGKGLGAV